MEKMDRREIVDGIERALAQHNAIRPDGEYWFAHVDRSDASNVHLRTHPCLDDSAFLTVKIVAWDDNDDVDVAQCVDLALDE